MEKYPRNRIQIKNSKFFSSKFSKQTNHFQNEIKINLDTSKQKNQKQDSKNQQFIFKNPQQNYQLSFAFTIGKPSEEQENKQIEEQQSPSKLGERTPQFNQASEFKSQKFQDCISSNQNKSTKFSQKFITSILEENLKLQKEIQQSNQAIKLLLRKVQTPQIYPTKHFFEKMPSNETLKEEKQPKFNKKAVSAFLGRSSCSRKNYLNVNLSEQTEKSTKLLVPNLNFQLPPLNLDKPKSTLAKLKKQAYFPKNDCKSENYLSGPDSYEQEFAKQNSLQNYSFAPPKKESRIALIKQVFCSKPNKKFL